MILQKQHHVLDLLLLLPALGDLIHPLFTDPFHIQKPPDIRLHDFQCLHAKFLHDPPGKLRSHSFDQPGTQVFLYAVNRRRHRFLPRIRRKLPPIFGIHLPVSLYQKDRAHIDIKKIPHKRHQIVIPFDAHFQNRVPVVRILVCNSLHNTAYLHNTGFLPLSHYQSENALPADPQRPLRKTKKETFASSFYQYSTMTVQSPFRTK